MRNLLALALIFLSASTSALAQKAPEGIWEGYDGEWLHVSQQLISLAEATPPHEKREAAQLAVLILAVNETARHLGKYFAWFVHM